MNKLFVKNLPKFFSNEDKKNFLYHYGSIDVVTFDSGKMKNCAFATFIDEKSTYIALRNLHQLELFGQRLVVEFAKKVIVYKTDSISLDEKKQKYFYNLNSISKKFRINYPISPLLKYEYPKATSDIIRNIAKALFNCSKFYTQVLHLMNKMNLPPPFINSDYEIRDQFLPKSFECKKNFLNSESSESEIDDNLNQSNETKDIISNKKKVKKRKINDNLIDYFEKINYKKRKINIKNIANIDSTSENFNLTIGFNKIEKKEISSKKEILLEKIEEVLCTDNKLDENDFVNYPVFKNYSVGEPCCRLYVKNVDKKISDNQLKQVFSHFLEKNFDKSLINVNLFKKGKMNGQAFIVYPNEELAKLAIDKTNGLILFKKPLVVCFARSCK